MSAFTGGASSIGGLSVPPSWATPLAVRQVAAALPSTAGPIVMQNSQTSQDSPYTGMALASVVGTSMAGLASRGAPAASGAATTPAANKVARGDRGGGEQTGPSSGAAQRRPWRPKRRSPRRSRSRCQRRAYRRTSAADLAATLAGIPGATIIVIPPPPPPE